MTQDFSKRSTWNRGRIAFSALALAALVLLGVLVSEVVREFRWLRTANSDNTHWTLSQAEVEFLEYREAIIAAMRPEAGSDALTRLVIEFDIFYSRMATFGTGKLFVDLRARPGFGTPIAEVRAHLDALVPIIDGPPETLTASLPVLLEDSDEIRLLLRRAATEGLQFFAEQAEASRTSVGNTLLRLAALTVAMFLALIFAMWRLQRASLQTQKRGRQLADAYARLNTILETSLDAVIVTDLDGHILTFNAAAERIFQYNHDAVLGHNLAEIIIPDHLRAAHEQGMQRLRQGGEMKVVGHGRVRLEAKRRDGSLFPVELALQKGQVAGSDVIVGFLRDISRLVASENALVEARDKALAGEKAKAEFLAMMTHEIRTPLNGLLGNLSLLKQTELGARQQNYLRNMEISGDLLMRHVDAVLDVARFEATGIQPQEEIVHLGQLLQDIVDSQASAATARGNRIRWEWAGPAVCWARLDGARMRQILLNLVGNAIKFTRNGQILIEAEVSEEAATMLEVRVIDTGIGIAKDRHSLVFDDFHTVSDVDTDISGTGLGLGIARRFVEALGGEIGLESVQGEGSVFWLRIPIQRVDAPDADALAELPPLSAPQNILLAEDNDINLELAREMLQHFGHRVVEARNGAEAVTEAARQRFDIILMDIRMPVMDGLQATQHIRQGDGPNRATPIIAVSANVLPEARERFLASGMSGFLPKPLDSASLASLVSTHGAGEAPAPEQDVTSDAGTLIGTETQRLAELKARYRAEIETFLSEAWTLSLPQVAETSHRLAGSAAAFGHTTIRAALVSLEIAAEQGEADGCMLALDEVTTLWRDGPGSS
ncbi:ATP-binding protein [Celeribacter sp. SCSIO 80788]|uniref:ATP-binding protein n=1 Tax=Celeribacter sp. SCSIO 80788 TaxID=3117013 RepID=UPI003DA50825